MLRERREAVPVLPCELVQEVAHPQLQPFVPLVFPQALEVLLLALPMSMRVHVHVGICLWLS